MVKLSGSVAIVTGGASGIGRALGEELTRRGARVVLADRQADLVRDVAARIGATGVELDVRDPAAFKTLCNDVAKKNGRLDFLFNNAGIAVGGEMDHYAVRDFDDVYDVNLRGVSYGIHAAYPIMIRQRFGHIVNTASVAGLIVSPGNGSYAASKHAVVALTKGLRMEGKRYGVRASVLCPGAVRTPILTGGKYGRSNVPASPDQILALWERARPIDPETLVKKALPRILANEAIIVVPGWWRALWLLDRLSPSLGMFAFSRIHERVRSDLAGGARTAEQGAAPSATVSVPAKTV
jgi:NAD(P)-dependent dehydrogenase (short-subunit alcohol dehydrogenase family)